MPDVLLGAGVGGTVMGSGVEADNGKGACSD